MINSLYTAQSGLSTSRYAIDTVANNIANENTEGYKKRTIETSEISLGDSSIGSGVSFDGVSRTTSQYLYNQLISQVSEQEYLSQEDEILSQIEILFSETDTSGLSVTISNFFESIENLRSTPSNEIYKTAFESQSEILISSLQDLYSDLETIEENTLSQLNNEVETINVTLEQIVYINEQIQQNGESNDLLDKRDALEMQLSEYGDIEVDTSNDNYSLKIGGSTVIFNNTNLHEVSIVEDTNSTYLTVYNNELNLVGGSLKSLTENLSEETSSISSIKQSLDDFTKTLVEEINSNSTSDLFSGDSVSTIVFNSSAINDLTSNDLEAIAQIQWGEDYNIDSTSTDTTSFSAFYQALLVQVSSNVENNNFKLEAQETVVQSLSTTLANQTSVDTDEEMIKLMEYQAAYEANAKVITVVDEMLQTLLAM